MENNTIKFGTGGIRALVGNKPGELNSGIVSKISQGVASYAEKYFMKSPIRVGVAFDSRVDSKEFAMAAAHVFSGNGFDVSLFPEPCPTPLLSFAIRDLKLDFGVMITASHNPKEYNGYKVFWFDGSQITSPQDKGIEHEINQVSTVYFDTDGIETVSRQYYTKYLDSIDREILNLSFVDSVANLFDNHLKVVYSPLHGVGGDFVIPLLSVWGRHRVFPVMEQVEPDGTFPTLDSPNPEDLSTFQLAIEEAKRVDADLVLLTDGDADRVGVAVKPSPDSHEYIPLTGNQMNVILLHYVLERYQSIHGAIPRNHFNVRTVTTTRILDRISERFGISCLHCLPGFKNIVKEKKNFDWHLFMCGCEESSGFLTGNLTNEKDGVAACGLFAELTLYLREKYGITPFQYLSNISEKYGVHQSRVVSFDLSGLPVDSYFDYFRKYPKLSNSKNINKSPISDIGGDPVYRWIDYENQVEYCGGKELPTSLGKATMFQFFTIGGTVLTIRPSGTEPKVKVYVEVVDSLQTPGSYEDRLKALDEKIDKILEEDV